MLAGIYYGAMYGGSTTSILVNIPGEAASVVTCIDGYQMARQGRAGPALGMSAFGSFIGGTVSVVAVMLISPFLAETALKFGPPEMFALLFFAFTCIGGLTGKSRARGLLMACVGLLLGTIGTDDIQGVDRFVFGTLYLQDGIGLVPLAMGLFGLGEILYNIEQREETRLGAGDPQEPPADAAGLEGFGLAHRARQLPRVRHRDPPGRHAGGGLALELRRSRGGCPSGRRSSATGPSRGWRGPRRRTTPPPPAASCRCSRWAFPPTASSPSCWRP